MDDNKRELSNEELNHVSGGEGIPHLGQDENIPHESPNPEDLEKKKKR